MLALPARLHQTRGLQLLQMLGGIGHGQTCRLRQLLHIALALGQKIQELQPRRAAQGACHQGQLLKQGVLRFQQF